MTSHKRSRELVCLLNSYTSNIGSDNLQDDSAQSQGYVQALVARIINNLQVNVRNVHVRYEDKQSVPGVKSLLKEFLVLF